ncbi:MAG: hypothetical protein P8X70_01865 [Nanoarchaeota archaeon]
MEESYNEKCFILKGVERKIIEDFFKGKKLIRDDLKGIQIYEVENSLVSVIKQVIKKGEDAVLSSDKEIIYEILGEHLEKSDSLELTLFYPKSQEEINKKYKN